jgi:sec-independent protein translocase protein TatA
MFDVGIAELVLILVVALLVFGPGRLPEIGAMLGRALRDFRQATQGFTDEITAIKQTGEELKAELEAAKNDVTSSLTSAAQEAKEAVDAAVATTMTTVNEVGEEIKSELTEANHDLTSAAQEAAEAVNEAVSTTTTPIKETAEEIKSELTAAHDDLTSATHEMTQVTARARALATGETNLPASTASSVVFNTLLVSAEATPTESPATIAVTTSSERTEAQS